MKKGLIVGALLGATAAGVTALLTTPKNGAEVRTALNTKYQNAKETAVQTAQTTKQKAQVEIAKFKARRLVSEIEQSEVTEDNVTQSENIVLNPTIQAEDGIAVASESILAEAEAESNATNENTVEQEDQVATTFQNVEIVKDEAPTNLWGKTVNRYRQNKIKNS